jgi:cytochrome bd ubiquinol oxidase subunit II
MAGGDQRGMEPRHFIDESITPVWEANHVWLVFDLVIFWTAFPRAFAAVMLTLALPLWLAVGGIVLRGAGFAFRKETRTLGVQRAAGAVFAFSSLLTPFFMGTVIGAIASGQVPAGATHASLAAWTGTIPLLTGFLFTGACGYLAAVYLTWEAASRGDQRMLAYFSRRAEVAAIVTGALSLAALLELNALDPTLFTRLVGRALPLVIVAGVCGLAVLGLLFAGRPRGVRVVAALGVAAVIWGWGIAQYPVLLPGTGITLANAGAPHATLVTVVVLAVVVALTIGPSFALLFSLHGRRVLEAGHGQAMLSAEPPAGYGAPAGRPSEGPSAAGRTAAIGLAAAVALIRALSKRHRDRRGT